MVGPLTTDELHQASKVLVKLAQKIEFGPEINDLQKKGHVSNKSKLLTLTPFLDKEGIIRVGGRLNHSNLVYNRKHPMILAAKGHITMLVIRKSHLETLHGGTQLTLAKTRECFWILNGRNTVRLNLLRCVECHRFKISTQQQLMGSLPKNRVTLSRPFSNVGVDYAGPIAVRVSKGRGNKTYKGYISLFVCLSTKAIHLELVSDLTSEAFIAAFSRFVGRRGRCANIYSDNGSNFVGADRLLKTERIAYVKAHQNKLKVTSATEGIAWHFIPPASPNFGGLWEAGVKSVKYHLKRVLGETSLTFEEFYTTLVRIEACLNSRPLYPLTEDPEDMDVLTPAHFLTGGSLLDIPQPDDMSKKISSLRRWELTRRLSAEFWNQWYKNYLNMLQHRPKRFSTTISQPKLNDVVLLKEDNMPPTRWKIARIVDVHPGDDGIIRVVTLKTDSSTFQRPTCKISILPIIDNS